MSQFFDLVAQQLNNEFSTTKDSERQFDKTWKQQNSYTLSRDQSWSHFTDLSINDSKANHSKIKRRPLKSNSKVLNRIKEDRFCSTQMKKVQNKVIDLQLNRLEKTINCSKNSNPRHQRQRILIRRLNFNKENQQKSQKHQSLHITSKFLQQIKDINEQLYEISLDLYRFYQRQRQQNDKISEQIKTIQMNIQSNSAELEEEKAKLNQIDQQLAKKAKEQREIQVSFMRRWLISEYK